MLIKFIDHKDKTHWVNPAYIRALNEKGAEKTQIGVSGSAMPMVVNGRPDDIAGLINLAIQEAALLTGIGNPATPAPAQIAEESTQAETTQAAIISSVVIGG